MTVREWTVQGLLQVEGDLWLVQKVVTTNSDNLAEMRGELDKAIKGLTALGVRSAITKGRAQQAAQQLSAPQAEIPAPHCDDHRIPMKPSKYKRDDGWITYYCPDKTGEEYCKNKAKVNPANPLEPTFYRSK